MPEPLGSCEVTESGGMIAVEWDAVAIGQPKPTPTDIQAILDSPEYLEYAADPALADARTAAINTSLASDRRAIELRAVAKIIQASIAQTNGRVNLLHQKINELCKVASIPPVAEPPLPIRTMADLEQAYRQLIATKQADQPDSER